MRLTHAPAATPAPGPVRLQVGDWVRVRQPAEILATLDTSGTCEGLPFMPEMLPSCGGQFQVSRRVHQICVEGFPVHQIKEVVMLDDLRCSGEAHDGCSKGCPLLWKTAWLRQDPSSPWEPHPDPEPKTPPTVLATRGSDGTYCCQSTQLAQAGRPVSRWAPQRWYQGLRHRRLSPSEMLRLWWTPVRTQMAARLGTPCTVPLRGPHRITPVGVLDLAPGDWVEVKALPDILATLDHQGRNRGLAFTLPMVPFCGGRYPVRNRIEGIIDEITGRMRHLKHTVALEGVTCDGSSVCGGCPRNVLHFWREIWLTRAAGPPTPPPS